MIQKYKLLVINRKIYSYKMQSIIIWLYDNTNVFSQEQKSSYGTAIFYV